jgi:ubiquitin carboxyl-terminal hydrolase 8
VLSGSFGGMVSPRVSPTRGGLDDNPYRSLTPNGLNSARETRSNSYVTVIILVSGSNIDQQHIEFPQIFKEALCSYSCAVLILKENVSAEELEERLVISPEHEQALFEKRNEYDLHIRDRYHTGLGFEHRSATH